MQHCIIVCIFKLGPANNEQLRTNYCKTRGGSRNFERGGGGGGGTGLRCPPPPPSLDPPLKTLARVIIKPHVHDVQLSTYPGCARDRILINIGFGRRTAKILDSCCLRIQCYDVITY